MDKSISNALEYLDDIQQIFRRELKWLPKMLNNYYHCIGITMETTIKSKAEEEIEAYIESLNGLKECIKAGNVHLKDNFEAHFKYLSNIRETIRIEYLNICNQITEKQLDLLTEAKCCCVPKSNDEDFGILM